MYEKEIKIGEKVKKPVKLREKLEESLKERVSTFFKSKKEIEEILKEEMDAFEKPTIGHLEKIFLEIVPHLKISSENMPLINDCYTFFLKTKPGRKLISKGAKAMMNIILNKKPNQLEKALLNPFIHPVVLKNLHEKNEKYMRAIEKNSERYVELGGDELTAVQYLFRILDTVKLIRQVIHAKGTVLLLTDEEKVPESALARQFFFDFITTAWYATAIDMFLSIKRKIKERNKTRNQTKEN